MAVDEINLYIRYNEDLKKSCDYVYHNGSNRTFLNILSDRMSRVGSKLCRLEYHESKQLVRRFSV